MEKRVVLFVIIGIFILGISLSYNKTENKPNNIIISTQPNIKPKVVVKYDKKAADSAQLMIDEGYIVYEGYGNFYVTPLFWNMGDYKGKMTIAVVCAHYYVSKGGDSLQSTIYDRKTGKRLAEVDYRGYTIEQQ